MADEAPPALTSHHLARYGAHSWRPGHPADPALCAEEVRGQGQWPTYAQCTRKRGHGPEGAFCKQHDPEARKARQAKADAAYRVKVRAWSEQHKGPSAIACLRVIAAGHNDPRTLATDWLLAANLSTPLQEDKPDGSGE